MTGRLLAPALAVAALAASCSLGGADESEPPRPAAAVARDVQAAVDEAQTVAVAATAEVLLDGAPDLGGVEAFLRGPVTLGFEGRVGRDGDRWARLAGDLTVETSAIELDAEMRSTDGRTFYLRIPGLLGDGWWELPRGDVTDTPRLDLAALFADATSERAGDDERLSGPLAVDALAGTFPGVIDDAIAAADTVEGTLTADAETHLPTAASLTVQADDLPDAGRTGVRGLDLDLEVRFSSWDEPFTVEAPPSARPLEGATIPGLGGLLPGA